MTDQQDISRHLINAAYDKAAKDKAYDRLAPMTGSRSYYETLDTGRKRRVFVDDTPESARIIENIDIAMRADTREQSLAHLEEAQREIEGMEREKARLSALYHELLLSVESVHEGESRHQTALRYIRERETFSCAPASDSSERLMRWHRANEGPKPLPENTDMSQDSTNPEPKSERESEGAVDQPRLVRKFFDLPLGTRFRYVGSDTVWVSIDRSGRGTIAKWDGVESSPTTQSICALAETKDECRTLEVEPVDLPNAATHAPGANGKPLK